MSVCDQSCVSVCLCVCVSVCVFRSARCFYVVSELNGKLLDVSGGEASAGASLIVYDRNPVMSVNQVWYEDETGLVRSKLNGYVIDTSSEPTQLILHKCDMSIVLTMDVMKFSMSLTGFKLI